MPLEIHMNTFLLVLVGLMFGMMLLALIAPIMTIGGMLVALFGLLTGNGALAGWGALAWLVGSGVWLSVGAKPVYNVN